MVAMLPFLLLLLVQLVVPCLSFSCRAIQRRPRSFAPSPLSLAHRSKPYLSASTSDRAASTDGCENATKIAAANAIRDDALLHEKVDPMRRRFLLGGAVAAVCASDENRVAPAGASWWGQRERLQLELCLVTVLRVRYWADSVTKSMTLPEEEARKRAYLEARLGCKALLTGRVGGGASLRVYELSSLNLRDSLADGAAWYVETAKQEGLGKAKKTSARVVEDVAEEIIDSLATCVEFDGLETTTDPSPRSSLTMSMYTDTKLTFVKRLLLERTIPKCDLYLRSFDPETVSRCIDFVKSNYPSEVPRELLPSGDDG